MVGMTESEREKESEIQRVGEREGEIEIGSRWWDRDRDGEQKETDRGRKGGKRTERIEKEHFSRISLFLGFVFIFPICVFFGPQTHVPRIISS